MKFTEERLEKAIIELFKKADYPYVKGDAIERRTDDVLIKGDLKQFLQNQYSADNITASEIESIIRNWRYYHRQIYTKAINLLCVGFPMVLYLSVKTVAKKTFLFN